MWKELSYKATFGCSDNRPVHGSSISPRRFVQAPHQFIIISPFQQAFYHSFSPCLWSQKYPRLPCRYKWDECCRPSFCSHTSLSSITSIFDCWHRQETLVSAMVDRALCEWSLCSYLRWSLAFHCLGCHYVIWLFYQGKFWSSCMDEAYTHIVSDVATSQDAYAMLDWLGAYFELVWNPQGDQDACTYDRRLHSVPRRSNGLPMATISQRTHK